MPDKFPIVGYGVVPALDGLSFDKPTVIASPPGETNRLFIAEKGGRIFVITNLAAPTKTLFLDVSADLIAHSEAGLLGLTFHPGFAMNGQFFLYRTAWLKVNGKFGIYDEVSRFTAEPANSNVASSESKVTLLAQYDNDENHNAGDMQFGPDGYLYIAVGESGPSPAEEPSPQAIDRHFFGSILRIDVDQRPESLPPNPYPSGISSGYLIPPDNPFIGATQHQGKAVDTAKVRTELYAIGLRNPWRIRFDSLTGKLYCGDVGGAMREEINVITSGANYGWPYFEGELQRLETLPPNFFPTAPLHSFAHGASHLVRGNCVIGGVVYRGNNIPQLYGGYVFGDFLSGRIWALRQDGNAVAVENIANVQNVCTFGVDPRNGDVLAASLDGGIWRLIYNSPESQSPVTLADTGAFSDLTTLTPNPGILPYDVALPFWSDGAIKTRWFSVPDPAQKITFAATSAWTFPTGAVWIKHFELELTNGVASSRKRIETRFLVKNSTGVYGVTYRWGDSRTNAWLAPAGGMEEAFVIRDGLLTRTQMWVYPSQAECLRCHNAAAGYVLGFSSAQLNCTQSLAGEQTNQIQLLSATSYLDSPPASVDTLPVLAKATEVTLPIQHRVRSYLNANCSACHFPGGPSGMAWDARITTPTALANIVNGPSLTGGDAYRIIMPGDLQPSMIMERIAKDYYSRMPLFGSTVLDTNGIALLTEYILGLPLRPWINLDIRPTASEGSASILNGLYQVHGSAADATEQEAGHILLRPFREAGQIVAQLHSFTSNAIAGITLREAATTNANCVTMAFTPNSLFQLAARTERDGETVVVTNVPTNGARWMRLVRHDRLVSAYISVDGRNWNEIADLEIDLGTNAFTGLTISSTTSATLASAAFTNVNVLEVALTVATPAQPIPAAEPVPLTAEAASSGAPIHHVAFYEGTNPIGVAQQPPYAITWSNSIVGEHLITAAASDISGNSVSSETIAFTRSMPRTRAAPQTRDAATRGNWRAKFGASAAIIAGDSTNLHSSIAFMTDASIKTWVKRPRSKRALARATGPQRSGSAWISPTNITVNLDFLDGRLHELALYFLDWERKDRTQQVEIVDRDSGDILASETLSKFRAGVYIRYFVRGRITVRITRLTGPNAVLSGIFVDDAPHNVSPVEIVKPTEGEQIPIGARLTVEAATQDPEQSVEKIEFFANGKKIAEDAMPPFEGGLSVDEPSSYSLFARLTDSLGETRDSPLLTIHGTLPDAEATLLRIDDTSHGNWIGHYGDEGFWIAGQVTNNAPYSRLDLGDAMERVYWTEGGEREMQIPGSDIRSLSNWNLRDMKKPEFIVDLTLWDGGEHTVAIYLLDPERARAERVEVLDAVSGNKLFSDVADVFGEGRYYVWKMRGHLKLRFTSTSGPFPVVSAFFFDAVPTAESLLDGKSALTATLVDGRILLRTVQPSETASSCVVEVSDDLITWSDASNEVVPLETINLGTAVRQTWEVRQTRENDSRRFYRLRTANE